MISNCYGRPLLGLRVLAGYDSERDVGEREMAVRGDREPGFQGGHCKGSDAVDADGKLEILGSKLQRWISNVLEH